MGTGVTYARKSFYRGTNKNDSEIVSYQTREMEHYADLRGIDIVESFSDVNYTGTNTDRPSLHALLNYVANNDIDCILFYSVDRMGRSNQGNIEIIQEISTYVNQVIFVSDGITLDGDSSSSMRLIFILLTAQASSFSEKHSIKISSSKQDIVKKEKRFIGTMPPLGYTLRKKDGRLIAATPSNTNDLKEIEGLKIVRLIFQSAIFGASYNQIAKTVDKQFSRSRKGRKWNDHTKIRSILNNPVYIGSLEGKSVNNVSYCVDQANVEPLVSPTVFYCLKKIQELKNGKRQPRILNRLPFFNICADCTVPLLKKGDYLRCSYCQGEILESDIQTYVYNTLSGEIKKPIYDFYTEIYERYNKKAIECRTRIEGLENLLMELNTYETDKEIKEIIRKTSKNLQEEKREYSILNGMLEEFSQMNVEGEIGNDYLYQNIIKAPYVIFIRFNNNLQNGEVQLLFWDSIVK